MRIFEPIYHRVIRFSQGRRAPHYLSLLSFVESFILPFPPPDVMLAPMALAQPRRAMHFAALTLTFSVLGGLVGYLIGAFLFEQARPYIVEWGYQPGFDTATLWFEKWGFWAVLVAGFSPVPYKIFTIAAGSLAMPLPAFVVASAVGRGARFFLVAALIVAGGEKAAERLRTHVETLGWLAIVAAGVLYLWLR